jgi:hypothetical protein
MFVLVVRIVVRMRVSVFELLVSMSMRVFWHSENLGLDSGVSSRFCLGRRIYCFEKPRATEGLSLERLR